MIQAIENRQSEIINRRAEALAYFRPMPMPAEVLEVLAPRRKQHMLDWMQSNYVLSEKSSRLTGPWRLDRTPFWRPVIEWLCDLTTRELWVYAARQTGKSTILGGWMGYVIDVVPGPMKIVLPSEGTAKKRIKKLKPAFEKSPRIMRHLGGDIRNLLIGEPTDLDNMQLLLGWPTSAITLEDDAIRYLGGDEVVLWTVEQTEDSDTIKTLRAGTRTYESISKRFFITRPRNKGDIADKNFEACQKWSIHIVCPDCGKYHEAMFENVIIDKDKDDKFFEVEYYEPGKGKRRTARYVCPHCNSRWSELERKAAISGCRACPEGHSIGPDGEIAGQWNDAEYKALTIPAVLVDPMFTTVDQLAHEFVAAIKRREAGDISAYRSFTNIQHARAWEQKERATSLTHLKTHVADYAMEKRLVPRRVQMICHGIDVQTDCVWAVTKGYGFRNEQWLLWAGRIETGHTGRAENWEIVEKYVRGEWVSAVDESVRYYATRAAIDCRYQQDDRDEESTVVYDFCLRFPEGAVIPVMGYGRDRMHNNFYKARDVVGKALRRFDLNVDMAKDRFWQSLFDKEKGPGPGYMHLPSDLPESLARQLASEAQLVKRSRSGREIIVWVKKPGFRENHLLDANNYCDLAAELAGVFHLQDVDYVNIVHRRKQEEKLGKEINPKPIRTRY
jgi:phage terminase large subunit GpA-like protein